MKYRMNRDRSVLAVAALAAVSLLPAQTGLPKGVRQGASVEGINEYLLDNGLRVLLFPDESKPKVTVNVTYMVGSRHEGYGETGMAHLLEHLLFKGTHNNPGLMKQLTERGAQFNGSTSFDRTNYFETLNATDDNLKWAIEMEADRMVNSKVAKSDLDTEMTVVRNEFEAGENSPFAVLMKRVMAAAFDWHNYGNTPIGARSDIEKVPIENLQAFYRRYYQPDNAMVVVAGKFDPAKALALIAASFGAIPRPERKLPATHTDEPTQDGERTVTVKRVGDAQYVMCLYHIPAGTHPDYAPLEVLGRVLADSPTGRLYKALVDNKKAASIMGGEFQNAEPGVSLFGAQVGKGQSLEEARRTLLATIESVIKEPPTAEEVERGKTKLLKQIELNMTDSQQIGIELSEWASMADWRMLFIHRDRLKQVKPEDVLRVAKAYFKEDNRTTGVFIPTEKPDRAEIPPTPDVTALARDYKGGAAVQAGEAFDPAPKNVESRTIRKTLSNGMKLVMLPKKTRGATVLAEVTLRYGDEKSLFGRETESELAWAMLMRGTTKHSRQQLRDEFDRLKTRVGVGGGVPLGSANLETVRANLAPALRLVAEVLREPAFAESEFESLKQSSLTQIEARRRDPQSVAMTELRRHLNPYPPGDVRAVRTPDEEVEEIRKTALAGARKFHQDFFGGSPSAVMTVVGDFDPAEISRLAEELFGGWKTPAKVERIKQPYRKIEAANKSFEIPDKPNALFAAGMNLELDDEHPDYPALVLANHMFGANPASRLWTRMREKEGWTYGVRSSIRAGTKENGGGFLTYAILAPENMPKLEAGFQEELKKAIDSGFGEEEFRKAKTSWLERQQVARAQDETLLGVLSGNAYWDRTMAWQEDLEKKVAALTLDQVNAAFRKYVTPASISIFKAGSFAKAAATAAKQ